MAGRVVMLWWLEVYAVGARDHGGVQLGGRAREDVMAWWWKPGQKVVCINIENFEPSFRGPVLARHLQQHHVYTIREVFNDRHWPRFSPLFRLEELRFEKQQWPFGYYEPGFANVRFRPVKDASIESLRALLNEPPDPTLVHEQVEACGRGDWREKIRLAKLLWD